MPFQYVGVKYLIVHIHIIYFKIDKIVMYSGGRGAHPGLNLGEGHS